MTQERVQLEQVAATSGDVLETQFAKLRTLFSEVVVEGKIDFDTTWQDSVLCRSVIPWEERDD